MNRLTVKKMNAIFGLKIQIAIGETKIVGLAVRTITNSSLHVVLMFPWFIKYVHRLYFHACIYRCCYVYVCAGLVLGTSAGRVLRTSAGFVLRTCTSAGLVLHVRTSAGLFSYANTLI